MDVSKVTKQDGIDCANLVTFLVKGRWDLSGAEADSLVAAKQWLRDLAYSMASQLDSSKQKPAADSMKIKAMGPLSSPKPSKRKK